MGLFKKKLTVNMAINKVRTTENAYLIDCRTKSEYKSGHVSGAINWPADTMTEERTLRRFQDKEAELYLVGSYNQKPEAAVKKFKKMGYRNVEAGGLMEEHHGLLVK